MRPFFPPRPGLTVYWPFLSRYSDEMWLAQRKFKGQRNLVYIHKKKVVLWSRHPENDFQHKNYTLSDNLRKSILQLDIPSDIEVVLDSELLHAKTKGCKDTIVLFDLLWFGKYLSDWKQEERLQKLSQMCGHPQKHEPGQRALQVCGTLWLAEVFQTNFLQEFKAVKDSPEIEGLVLRRRGSRLRDGNLSMGKRRHEVPWMARVRKSEKGYHH